MRYRVMVQYEWEADFTDFNCTPKDIVRRIEEEGMLPLEGGKPSVRVWLASDPDPIPESR